MRKQKKFFLGVILSLMLFFSWPISFNQNVLAQTAYVGVTDPKGKCDEVGTSEGTSGGFLTFKGSVVPCGRNCDIQGTEVDESETCTLCHFILMAKNIYDLLFAMVIFAAILAITIGGTIYMVSFGNSKAMGMGKDLITKTLIGFALFLLGELIVFSVLSFVGVNFGLIGSGTKWYEFTCDTKSIFGSDVTAYTYSKPDQFQGYASAGCPTTDELKNGFSAGITEYCKPKREDFKNETDFLCAVAMNCSCPASGKSSEKSCQSSTMSWAPCMPFDDKAVSYCNKTASGSAPQPGRTVAADTSCSGIKFGAQLDICGKTYTVEDTGGAIKGKRFDVFIDDCKQAKSYTCEVKGL